MNRMEFVRRVAHEMRENNMRKPVSTPKHVFHISDDEGNSKDFVIKKSDKSVLYTVDDVEAVVNTCIDVIKEVIQTGEPISIKGLGTLGLHHRKARRTVHPETGKPVEVAARYVPKFSFGNDLRRCAKIFELSLEDNSCYLDEYRNVSNEMEGGE